MRKLVLIAILLGFSLQGWSSHIVGGEIFYDHLGANEYRVTVKLYRDCLSDGAEFDQNLPITVFNGSGGQIHQFSIPFPGSTNLDVEFSNPCVTIPSDICVEEAVYTKVVFLPASANGWTLSYQRCCRGPNVVNLIDPGGTGLTLTVDIPAQSSIPSNSSPRFNNFPPLLLCANQELVFDHSATDPDGDDLVYELCTPYEGGESFNPAPNPAAAPPYGLVNWQGGMNATNPFGNGTITIDPNTGLMVANPGQQGLYAVGVCVKEYRNGVLIGTSVRDFLFRVMNCEVELEADMVQQPDLSTFESYCQGLTVSFENNSWGGDNYFWDFGVDGTTDDTSTEFAPVYTYPVDGTYDVMLVVNPGWPCTDTSYGTFIVNNEIDASFIPPAAQCVVDNSFDFQGEGTFPSVGTTFEWNFGNASDVTPDAATTQDVNGVVYNSPGQKPVTFTVYYDQCEASHTEMITVAEPPAIFFTVPDELKCVPYTAQFINQSTADTEIFSSWTFGDGGTSSEFSPAHTYVDTGLFDVSLTIWTTSGCIDTLTMDMPNSIEVFPRPTAGFSVTPFEQLIYDNEFYFTDESIDAVDVWYYFGDGQSANSDSASHTYTEAGVFNPYQIVYNEYGCRDVAWGLLQVTPVLDIMVPNAFTPNGDSHNNVFQPVLFEDQVYEIWIYNRWGELIHYEEALNANWDGAYEGVLVPDGIYVWQIKYTSFLDDLTPIVKKGHVMVLK